MHSFETPITITQPTDPRMHIFQLRDRGVFLAARTMLVDSERIIRRFLRHGLTLESLLGTPDLVVALREEGLPSHGASIFQASRDVLEAIVGFRFHQGAIALFRQPADTPLGALGPRVMACDGVGDAENIGAIVRTAHAMGFTGLLVGETACSPWLRRAIRVSMGSIIKLGVRHCSHLATDLAILAENGATVVGLAASREALCLSQLRPSLSQVVLVAGAENDGLSPAVRTHCSVLAGIPMADGCDSLNVAAAAAIGAFWFRRLGPG